MDLVETLSVLQRNLFSPLTLAFVLGMIATLVKSDIEFPDQAYKFIALYLMFAIGLNGGVELAGTTFTAFALPALVTVALAIILPVLCFFVLRGIFKLDCGKRGRGSCTLWLGLLGHVCGSYRPRRSCGSRL